MLVTHATVGGIIADLQCGKFAHGFVSAGVTKALTPAISGIDSSMYVGYVDVGQAMMAALIGGSISAASGGDFANGALTAALANIYNQQMSDEMRKQFRKHLEDDIRLLESDIKN